MPTRLPTTTTTSDPTTRTAVVAAALVGALASAGYVSGVLFSHGMSNSEGQRAPLTVTEAMRLKELDRGWCLRARPGW